MEFRVPNGSPEIVYKRIEGLFKEAQKRPHWKEVFDQEETLKLRGEALKLTVAALERYTLLGSDLDIVDAAFEYLINPEQKGEKGQYFTPRPVVKMVVEMLQPKDGEKVIDPGAVRVGSWSTPSVKSSDKRAGAKTRVTGTRMTTCTPLTSTTGSRKWPR